MTFSHPSAHSSTSSAGGINIPLPRLPKNPPKTPNDPKDPNDPEDPEDPEKEKKKKKKSKKSDPDTSDSDTDSIDSDSDFSDLDLDSSDSSSLEDNKTGKKRSKWDKRDHEKKLYSPLTKKLTSYTNEAKIEKFNLSDGPLTHQVKFNEFIENLAIFFSIFLVIASMLKQYLKIKTPFKRYVRQATYNVMYTFVSTDARDFINSTKQDGARTIDLLTKHCATATPGQRNNVSALNYIKRFNVARRMVVSVGNKYCPDTLVDIFLNKIATGSK